MTRFSYAYGACCCTRDKCSIECQTYAEYGPKHITKADQIRSMTDEELAGWIVAIIAQETIYSARKVPTPDDAIEMRQRWLEWLKQECER